MSTKKMQKREVVNVDKYTLVKVTDMGYTVAYFGVISFGPDGITWVVLDRSGHSYPYTYTPTNLYTHSVRQLPHDVPSTVAYMLCKAMTGILNQYVDLAGEQWDNLSKEDIWDGVVNMEEGASFTTLTVVLKQFEDEDGTNS